MRWRTAALVAVFVALLAGALLFVGPVFRAPRTVLYVGGPILTMDPEDRVVEALLVRGDRIVAAGSEAEVRARAPKNVVVVDLGGQALLPGFVDAHSHFPGDGLFAVYVDLRSPPAGTVRDVASLVARLRGAAGDGEGTDWLVGFGYDDTLLADHRHPTRQDLDRVSATRPVAAVHVSGHIAAVNSRALEELGVGPDSPDPPGGRIQRGEDGRPSGVLEEEAAAGVLSKLGSASIRDGLQIVRAGSRAYLRAGVTCAQNGLARERDLRTMPWLVRLGLVPLRLVLWPAGGVVGDRPAATFSPHPQVGEWTRVGAVKLVADGSIQGYTAYLTAPYHVPPGADPSYRGYPRMDRQELVDRVRALHRGGWQIAVHGNGDAAIDDILDAFEAAQREYPRPDARHVIVHAQTARPDQLDRMKQLGVIPSFFALHVYYWGDRHREIFLGPERAARISPARSAAERGLRFTLHTDSPVVPMNPLLLVWAAVNRITSSGRVLGPQERISPMRALRAVTIDAARQAFLEKSIGSLEPGKRADMVILSASPLADPGGIRSIRVVETIIGGRTVYRAP